MTSASKNSILDFHQKLIEQNGVDSATGFSPERQAIRFEIMLRAIRSLDAPAGLILDYGCSCGDFLRYLMFCRNPFGFSYAGVDLNPKFIDIAKERYNIGKFYCDDATEKSGQRLLANLKPNIVVSSGVFCYPARKKTAQQLLKTLFLSADKAAIVNFLSAEQLPGMGSLVRYKPEEVIGMARKCGCKSFELWHNYMGNDMTLLMRKEFTHA